MFCVHGSSVIILYKTSPNSTKPWWNGSLKGECPLKSGKAAYYHTNFIRGEKKGTKDLKMLL